MKMTKAQVYSAFQGISAQLADEMGYSLRADGVYTRSVMHVEEWFHARSEIVHGVGEFTPYVGLDIPSLSGISAMVPGLERSAAVPTFGGPIFRLADLAISPIHDFVLKVREQADVEVALSRLRSLWAEIAMPFLEEHHSASAWLKNVDGFLRGGRLGMLAIPKAGRTCVLLVYAARGRAAATVALDQLSKLGPGGQPVQDFEESRRLTELIDKQPDLIVSLQKAFMA